MAQYWLCEDDAPGDFHARVKRRGRSRSAATPHRRKLFHRRAAVLAAAVTVPAVAAPGDWDRRTDLAEPAPAVMPMPFERPGESFPGSAFYYLADQPYLPAEPVALSAAAAAPAGKVLDPGPAARAMQAGGSGIDKARAQECLAQAIYYEAASESDAGQRAVAQVVLNRVAHRDYPATVCGVVFEGSQRETGCQFSFTCDGSMARRPSRLGWSRASQVARAALSGAVYAPVGLATHYHTLQVSPYWASSLDHVGTIGAHRFYRWKGVAGQPVSFSTRYSGREPLTAPRYDAALETPPAAPRALPEIDLPQPMPLPLPEEPVLLPQADRLPVSGRVREEYARSGQWKRQP